MTPRSALVRAAFGAAVLASAGCRAYGDDAEDAALLLAATRPADGGAAEGAAASRDGDVALGMDYLDKKQTVRLKGRFDAGVFRAGRVEVADDDKEVELKGPLGAFARAEGRGDVGGVAFRVPEDAALVDGDGRALPDDAASPGVWAKAECRPEDEGLRLVKLTLRARKPGEDEVLAGRVTKVDRGKRRVVVGGTTAVVAPSASIVWARDGEPPPFSERFVVAAEAPRPRRRIYEDPDEWRPDTSLILGDVLTIGGQLRYDLEWRENHDLDPLVERDRLIHDATAKLEISADLDRHVFAFASGVFDYAAVHFDEDANLDLGATLRLEEAFVRVEDLPFDGLSLQLGRQRFDEGREWVVRDEWDAARLGLQTDLALFEVSVGEEFVHPDAENENVVNWLATARLTRFADQEFLVYLLKRKSDAPRLLDRNHFGISGEGDFGGGLKWSGEIGFSRGFEDGAPLRGFGVDVSLLQVFRRLPLRPYVYAGFAHGSGDGVLDDGIDQNFRQTGLHRNNDRFGGVAGFRYYGELFRPDLQNLQAFTVGVGCRPSAASSVDLVLHWYKQDVPYLLLGPSRLRRSPNGLDDDLGFEADLIVGLEDWRPWEFEIDLGYFAPGGAFDAASDAWFLVFTAKYSF